MGCCGSSESTPNTDEIDLSHFIVARVLGRGGFGKVNAIQRKFDKLFYALKTVSKHMLLRSENNYSTCITELKCMKLFDSPFLVNCVHAFQDLLNLYIVMPLMEGGDLRYLINNRGIKSEEELKFYAAEIILALEAIHENLIIYRDLKPDNVLLDLDGHCRISDFGLSHFIAPNGDGKAGGYAGTNGYSAPEMDKKLRYDYSVDYYSLGVCLYELIHKRKPKRLSTDSKSGEIQYKYSRKLTTEAKDLFNSLLQQDPANRLGNKPGDLGWTTVKAHPFFSRINWTDAAARKLRPPFIPTAGIANCDPVYELEEQIMKQDQALTPLTPEQQSKFNQWNFNTDINGINPTGQFNIPEPNVLFNEAGSLALHSLSNTSTTGGGGGNNRSQLGRSSVAINTMASLAAVQKSAPAGRHSLTAAQIKRISRQNSKQTIGLNTKLNNSTNPTTSSAANSAVDKGAVAPHSIVLEETDIDFADSDSEQKEE